MLMMVLQSRMMHQAWGTCFSSSRYPTRGGHLERIDIPIVRFCQQQWRRCQFKHSRGWQTASSDHFERNAARTRIWEGSVGPASRRAPAVRLFLIFLR